MPRLIRPQIELAAAVHDRRYGLGPLSVYLRDPQVENVDINGYDQPLANSSTVGNEMRLKASQGGAASSERRICFGAWDITKSMTASSLIV